MLLAFVVIASASCSTAIRWEKPGVGAGERQRDETDWTSLATRASTVPTQQSVARTSGTPVSPQDARIQPYDADRFEDCMRTRGYERVPARLPA